MSSLEIEDVLASIRRLVSDDLRPANRPNAVGKLLLTPALRVVPPVVPAKTNDASADVASDAVARDGWVRDPSTHAAIGRAETDHLDFTRPDPIPAAPRSALQSAAEAFHAHADEFILSYSDTGTVTLRGDTAHPTAIPSTPADHGAVFAVLNAGRGPVDVAPVQALVDAEGGAPVEDDTGWSTVSWDDAADALADDDGQGSATVLAHATVPATAVSDKEGPLVLSFISARRTPAADVLTLRSPLVEVMSPADVADDTPAAPLVLTRSKPKMKPKHLARMEAERASDNGSDTTDSQAQAEDFDAASSFVGQAMADATEGDDALDLSDPVRHEPDSVTAEQDHEPTALPAVATQEAPPAQPGQAANDVTDGDPKKVALAASSARPDAEPGTSAREPAVEPVSARPSLRQTALTVTPRSADASAAGSVPGRAPDIRARPAAKLSEAAFTRWPGWAQPDPDQWANAGHSILPAPLPPLPASEPAQKKPKAAVQDLGWADRAEAEIHRRLAAELGPAVTADVAAPAPALQLSEAALRDLVRDMIREELTGKLGERITQNVRKLVQMELQKSMSMHAGEFRSHRRSEPD